MSVKCHKKENKLKILIMHCHTNNRGDEAAVHALVDELNRIFNFPYIVLAMRDDTYYPNMPDNVVFILQYAPGNFRSVLLSKIACVSGGKILGSERIKNFVREIETSDIVLHAPGGPSIGDTYYKEEPTYLRTYDMLHALHKKYMFYAPSMGPFNKKKRNSWRKKVISRAEAIVLRDPLSADYVRELVPQKQVIQTLDSALQHEIDEGMNKWKLENYGELNHFLSLHDYNVGITITDLLWHPVYSNKKAVLESITESFIVLIEELTKRGYGVVFIPQLYGHYRDYDLMEQYSRNEDCFVMADDNQNYDSYFQQYVIGQLYAVIGMRYHSNIFSAKMGTPFISVSYEQKMKGFMNKIGLSRYCIDLEDLSPDILLAKFELLNENYNAYMSYLNTCHDDMKKEACRTTGILKSILDNCEEGK